MLGGADQSIWWVCGVKHVCQTKTAGNHWCKVLFNFLLALSMFSWARWHAWIEPELRGSRIRNHPVCLCFSLYVLCVLTWHKRDVYLGALWATVWTGLATGISKSSYIKREKKKLITVIQRFPSASRQQEFKRALGSAKLKGQMTSGSAISALQPYYCWCNDMCLMFVSNDVTFRQVAPGEYLIFLSDTLTVALRCACTVCPTRNVRGSDPST